MHFTTHAVIGDRVKWVTQPAILSPEGTGRGDDGILKMSKNLRLMRALLVLFACETALERISRLPIPPALVTQHLVGRRGSIPLDLWRWQAPTTSNRAFSATSIAPRLH